MNISILAPYQVLNCVHPHLTIYHYLAKWSIITSTMYDTLLELVKQREIDGIYYTVTVKIVTAKKLLANFDICILLWDDFRALKFFSKP